MTVLTRDFDRLARLIHVALLASMLAIGAIFVAMRMMVPMGPTDVPRYIFWVVGVAVTAGHLMVMRVIRGRIPEYKRSMDRADWWRVAFPPAVLIWALAVGMALIGTVLWFVTGDAALLFVVAAGLIALLWNRPGSLAGE